MIDDSDNGKNNPQGPAGADDTYYTTSPEDRYRDSQNAAEGDAPAVSAPAAKNFIFVGVLVLIIAVVMYAFFSGGSSTKPTKIDKPFTPLRADRGTPVPFAQPEPLPSIDVPPPLPPAAETAPNTSLFGGENNGDRVKRYKSEMLITRPGILSGNADNTRPDGSSTLTDINDNDPGTGFADSFYNQKDAPFAQARKLGDTSRLITQGKIVESVLETPINTDVPGMIRAIVSHDIYAESGRIILIPKGSRLVGTYNNFTIRGNKRVNIIWTRVIRPDGIDVMIRSGGADQLGRAGLAGDVDNKYLEIFSSAFLVSAINIAAAVGADALDTSKRTSTTNTDGSTTTTSSATQEAGVRAIDMFGNAGQNLVDGFLNLKPTLTIDQGTRVNVFVNRDLIFPANLVGQVKYVK